MQMVIDSGKKHLCIEKDQNLQPTIDAVATGRMSPEQYADLRKLETNPVSEMFYRQRNIQMARSIRMLSQNGIKTHCVGVDGEKETHYPDYWEDVVDGRRFADDMCQSEQGITNATVAAWGLTHWFSRWRNRDQEAAFLRERSDDTAVTKNIIKACNGEPAVIIFGNAHFGRQSKSIRSILAEYLRRRCPNTCKISWRQKIF